MLLLLVLVLVELDLLQMGDGHLSLVGVLEDGTLTIQVLLALLNPFLPFPTRHILDQLGRHCKLFGLSHPFALSRWTHHSLGSLELLQSLHALGSSKLLVILLGISRFLPGLSVQTSEVSCVLAASVRKGWMRLTNKRCLLR